MYLAVWVKVCDFLSIEQSAFMINGSDEYLSIAKIMYPVITQSSGLEEVSLVNYDSFYVGHMQCHLIRKSMIFNIHI